MGRADRHLAAEVLHAFAAGELDPARREACLSHIEDCEACRAKLANVLGVRHLMRDAQAPDLDDLAWRRLQMRVRTQLFDEARVSGPTQDLSGLRTRWRTAGLVAVAAVALLVWFAPGRRGAPPPKTTVVAAVVQHVHAREAPVDVQLRSGVDLELGPRGRMEMRPGPGPGATIALDTGTLDVRDLRPPAVTRPIRVEVSPYFITATHADFQVRRLAGGAAVAVVRGEVRVRSPEGPTEKVGAGERRVFAPAQEPEPAKVVVAPRPARRPVRPASVKPAPVEPVPAPPAPAAPAVQPASPSTEVVVSYEPPADPIRAKLQAARRAYYVDGALDRAVALAEQVRAKAEAGPERRGAIELLCQAYTAAQRPERAVQTCEAVLEGPVDRATRRMLHKQLADIHRTQRGDCMAAIGHYNRVLVFGLSTPLDDASRLLRAECALEVGDTMLAERDLAQLEASSSLRGQDALTRLRERVFATRGAQDREGVTDSR